MNKLTPSNSHPLPLSPLLCPFPSLPSPIISYYQYILFPSSHSHPSTPLCCFPSLPSPITSYYPYIHSLPQPGLYHNSTFLIKATQQFQHTVTNIKCINHCKFVVHYIFQNLIQQGSKHYLPRHNNSFFFFIREFRGHLCHASLHICVTGSA